VPPQASWREPGISTGEPDGLKIQNYAREERGALPDDDTALMLGTTEAGK
jgi:hypothetical protein